MIEKIRENALNDMRQLFSTYKVIQGKPQNCNSESKENYWNFLSLDGKDYRITPEWLDFLDTRVTDVIIYFNHLIAGLAMDKDPEREINGFDPVDLAIVAEDLPIKSEDGKIINTYTSELHFLFGAGKDSEDNIFITSTSVVSLFNPKMPSIVVTESEELMKDLYLDPEVELKDEMMDLVENQLFDAGRHMRPNTKDWRDLLIKKAVFDEIWKNYVMFPNERQRQLMVLSHPVPTRCKSIGEILRSLTEKALKSDKFDLIVDI